MRNFKGTQHSSNYWKLQATQLCNVSHILCLRVYAVFVLFIYLFIPYVKIVHFKDSSLKFKQNIWIFVIRINKNKKREMGGTGGCKGRRRPLIAVKWSEKNELVREKSGNFIPDLEWAPCIPP